MNCYFSEPSLCSWFCPAFDLMTNGWVSFPLSTFTSSLPLILWKLRDDMIVVLAFWYSVLRPFFIDCLGDLERNKKHSPHFELYVEVCISILWIQNPDAFFLGYEARRCSRLPKPKSPMNTIGSRSSILKLFNRDWKLRMFEIKNIKVWFIQERIWKMETLSPRAKKELPFNVNGNGEVVVVVRRWLEWEICLQFFYTSHVSTSLLISRVCNSTPVSILSFINLIRWKEWFFDYYFMFAYFFLIRRSLKRLSKGFSFSRSLSSWKGINIPTESQFWLLTEKSHNICTFPSHPSIQFQCSGHPGIDLSQYSKVKPLRSHALPT